MLDTTDGTSLADLLGVIGPTGALFGAAIAAATGPPRWRETAERLALGAATGGVAGYFVAFVAYDIIHLLG